MTGGNMGPLLYLYLPFHPFICRNPQILLLSLPFPLSRKQVLLGWVGTLCGGGASREADNVSEQRESDTSACRARDGDCSWWVCSHMFLQHHLTIIYLYQKSHTNISLHPVLNIYKKLRVKTTRPLYIKTNKQTNINNKKKTHNTKKTKQKTKNPKQN